MPNHDADIADLPEIDAANSFRIRAYRNAARMIGELSTEAYALFERREELTRIPGVGHDLAATVEEVPGGYRSLLDRLHTEVPPAAAGLLKVPGLGPKRVRPLHHDLGVQTIGQLYGAARVPASLSTVSVSQETNAMWDDEPSIQLVDRFVG